MSKISLEDSSGSRIRRFLSWFIPASLLGTFLGLSIASRNRFTLPFLLLLLCPPLLLLPYNFVLSALIAISFAMQRNQPGWSVHIGSLMITMQEIFIMLSLGLLFLDTLSGRRKLVLSPLVLSFIPILLFFFISLYLGLENNNPTSFVNQDIHRAFGYLSIFPLAVFFKGKSELKYFYLTIILATSIIIFYILSPLLLGPLSPVKSAVRGRICVTNVVLFPFVLPFFAQLYLQTEQRRVKILTAIFLPISLLALLLTQIRVAWVGVVIAFLLFFLLNYFWLVHPRKRKAFLLRAFLFLTLAIFVLGLIVFFFFQETFLSFWRLRFLTFKFLRYDPALMARGLGIYESKVLFSRAPFFGNGFGATWHSVGYPMASTDNFYWLILVKFGLIGSILLLLPYLFWGRELIYIFKKLREIKSPLHSALLVGTLVFYPTIFIMQLVVAHLFISPSVVVVTISLMALTDFTYRKLKASEDI